MKINLLRSLFFLTIFCLQIFFPSKIVAHPHCESSFNCGSTPETLAKIDYWTNYFFKLIRPEMRHTRVRVHHTLYRREVTEIRKVVTKVIYESCQQPHLNYYYLLSTKEKEASISNRRRGLNRQERIEENHGNTYNNWERSDYDGNELLWDRELWSDGYYWQRTEGYFFDGLYQDLTNGIFYARHPELSRDINIKDNLNWATEWTFIRQYFVTFEEEIFLKQHLIPLCNRKTS